MKETRCAREAEDEMGCRSGGGLWFCEMRPEYKAGQRAPGSREKGHPRPVSGTLTCGKHCVWKLCLAGSRHIG